MTVNVTTTANPLCIYADEARFHSHFLPGVNNIIIRDAHSCSAHVCVCQNPHICICKVGPFWLVLTGLEACLRVQTWLELGLDQGQGYV